MEYQIDESGKMEQTLPISPSPLVGEGRGEGRKRKAFFLRKLRSNQTDVEKTLWHKLRNRRLSGIKFRRQVPIRKYIVDFVSFEKRLIIELDGG